MTSPWAHEATADVPADPIQPAVSPPEDVLNLAATLEGRELLRAVWQAGFDFGWAAAGGPIAGNAVRASDPTGRPQTATDSTGGVTGSPEPPTTAVDAYGGINR